MNTNTKKTATKTAATKGRGGRTAKGQADYRSRVAAQTKKAPAKKTAAAKSAPAKTVTETLTRPEGWVVGEVVKGGWTVVRVRSFFAVIKKAVDGKPTLWAVDLIDGTRLDAVSSSDAGEKGRKFRDAQQAKGVKVKQARTATKAPAKKAPAKKAAAEKAPAKKAPAKKAAAKKAPAKAAAKKAAR